MKLKLQCPYCETLFIVSTGKSRSVEDIEMIMENIKCPRCKKTILIII